MSNVPEALKYTKTHEWLHHDEDGLIVVGITDYAQESLGDIVYVQVPELDEVLLAAVDIAVVESIKVAADIYMPMAGRIVAVNEALEEEPQLLNKDPYGAGWLYKIEPQNPEELADFLSAREYAELCSEESDDS